MNLATGLRIPAITRQRSAPAPPPAMTASQAMRGRFGRWDSKTTDRMNSAHWNKASGLPINAELAYASNWLRAQSEYEISSNPVMEGLVNSHITDVVGPEGPSYRVTSSDPEYNKKREKVWRDWARHAGANRQLSLVEILANCVRALWKAGEYGIQMINDPDAEGPIKMRLLPVHMHRLLTPPEMLGDPDVALGVRRDKNRNPTSYYISEPYIFGPFEIYTGEFYEVRFEDFIHGYELTEEDQVRGVPWLATSLDTVAQIRDWDKSMLDAAETVSKTGVVWSLKKPGEARSPSTPARRPRWSAANIPSGRWDGSPSNSPPRNPRTISRASARKRRPRSAAAVASPPSSSTSTAARAITRPAASTTSHTGGRSPTRRDGLAGRISTAWKPWSFARRNWPASWKRRRRTSSITGAGSSRPTWTPSRKARPSGSISRTARSPGARPSSPTATIRTEYSSSASATPSGSTKPSCRPSPAFPTPARQPAAGRTDRNNLNTKARRTRKGKTARPPGPRSC